MSQPSLFDRPEDAIRTLGLLIPAIVSDDQAIAETSLRFAKILSARIAETEAPPAPVDAALHKIAGLLNQRAANASPLTRWDRQALVNACLEALNIPHGEAGPRLFETAIDLLEGAWRDDGHIR